METMVKGYMIQFTGRFILEDPELRERFPASIRERAEHNVATLKPSSWYPRQDLIDFWCAVADASPDEERARVALRRCGKTIGTFAAGTFLKLLFKVLTPKMFAYKFPDLWKRDSQGGYIEVPSVEPNSMKLIFKDVEGFTHLCAISEGYVGFVLESMGLKNLKVESHPWSLAEPSARDVHFEAKWE